LADRFIIEVALIDYGLVFLLKPFGFHLTVDTLPSGGFSPAPEPLLPGSDMSPLIRDSAGL
jgi:hypothetical protein